MIGATAGWLVGGRLGARRCRARPPGGGGVLHGRYLDCDRALEPSLPEREKVGRNWMRGEVYPRPVKYAACDWSAFDDEPAATPVFADRKQVAIQGRVAV